jgi:hypothetical protein
MSRAMLGVRTEYEANDQADACVEGSEVRYAVLDAELIPGDILVPIIAPILTVQDSSQQASR